MAAPESDKATDKASEIENPPTESGAAVPPSRPTPKRRRGGALSKIVVSALALLVGLGAAGYAALTFRDLDPRIGLAADYVEQGLAEAQGALDKAQGLIADLTGSQKPAPKTLSRHALLEKAPLTPAPVPVQEPSLAPQSEEGAPAPAPVEVAKEPEKPEDAPAPEPPPKPAEMAQEPAPAPVAEPSKPPSLAKVEMPDSEGFTDRDLISALEGRIDALSDEVQALRQKLDAPKSEGRAAPETDVSRTEETPKSAPAVRDTTSARVVVAFALQQELAAGKPYVEEIAALSRLDAEPAPILVELADKGAPTGEQLRESLQAIAKKLEAHETHAETHGVTEQLLESASKLVKVRPSGRAHPESLAGKIERIEAALGHNDFAAAESLFDSLPEEAKAAAKEFGDALHRRSEAAKAADDLLRGAIAALGKK